MTTLPDQIECDHVMGRIRDVVWRGTADEEQVPRHGTVPSWSVLVHGSERDALGGLQLDDGCWTRDRACASNTNTSVKRPVASYEVRAQCDAVTVRL